MTGALFLYKVPQPVKGLPEWLGRKGTGLSGYPYEPIFFLAKNIFGSN